MRGVGVCGSVLEWRDTGGGTWSSYPSGRCAASFCQRRSEADFWLWIILAKNRPFRQEETLIDKWSKQPQFVFFIYCWVNVKTDISRREGWYMCSWIFDFLAAKCFLNMFLNQCHESCKLWQSDKFFLKSAYFSNLVPSKCNFITQLLPFCGVDATNYLSSFLKYFQTL